MQRTSAFTLFVDVFANACAARVRLYGRVHCKQLWKKDGGGGMGSRLKKCGEEPWTNDGRMFSFLLSAIQVLLL